MDQNIPQDETLNASMPRTNRFLTAAAKRSIYRILSQKGGYSRAQHMLGLSLLTRAMGISPEIDKETSEDVTYKELEKEIAWCSDNDDTIIARIAAALEFHHDAAHTFMLTNISQGSGAQAVANLKLIVERFALMKSDPDKIGSSEASEAAIKTLAERGLDKDFFDGIALHVQGAEDLPDIDADAHEGSIDLSAAEIREARIQLYFWHKGWAKVANTVITRRDWLIQLGLARRRRNSSNEDS